MVVFLFVVMLLNLGDPGEIADMRGKWGRLAAGLLGLVMLAQILAMSNTRLPGPEALAAGTLEQQTAEKGAIGVVADPLFTDYLLAFELTSIVLLVAIVGAVVLAKRRTADAR
jgi:NADH-quinone oxidoreductase subunit J